MDSASLLRDLEERRERQGGDTPKPANAIQEAALEKYHKVKGDPKQEQEAVLELRRLGVLNG